MGEFMGERLRWAEEESNEMIRLGLLPEGEVNNIMEKRRQSECEIAEKARCEHLYNSYITYEENVSQRISMARLDQKVPCDSSNRKLEDLWTKRMLSLYRQSVTKLPKEVRLWHKFLDFYTESGTKLKVHSFLDLVAHNLKNFPNVFDLTFSIKLLKFSEKHTNTDKFQKSILDHMTNAFCREPLMYNTLAERERDGKQMYIFEQTGKFGSPDELPATTRASSIEEFRYLCGFEVYNVALKSIRTEEMWQLYADFTMDLYVDTSLSEAFRRTQLLACFRQIPIRIEQLSPTTHAKYLQYLIILNEKSRTEMIGLLQNGVQKHADCVEMWSLYMRYHILNDEEKDVVAVFKRGCKKLASNAKPLWTLIIAYYQTRLLSETFQQDVEDYYMRASVHQHTAFFDFRCQYLSFIAAYRGIKYARAVYRKLYKLTPFHMDLHKQMLNLEMLEKEKNMEELRLVHKNIVDQFGMHNTNVWIDFIKFERDQSSDITNVTNIFNLAKKVLTESKLFDVFLVSFNTLALKIN